MARLQELPKEAQEILLKIGGGQKTVYTLVDELGWSQTEVQKWLTSLERSGWLVSSIVPDASPSGGSAQGFRRKETV